MKYGRLGATFALLSSFGMLAGSAAAFAPAARGPKHPVAGNVVGGAANANHGSILRRTGPAPISGSHLVALKISGGASSESIPTGDSHKGYFGLASAWGVVSVVAILANALKRLVPVALQPFTAGDFTIVQWGLYYGFSALMAYAEGYKGFHMKFSPMVVKRALTLDQDAGPVRVLLAGPYSMGLFHSTKKRKIVSWSLAAGVFGLVQLVKRLPYPWRSIVDAGVVTGLSTGALSIVLYWAQSWFGKVPDVNAEMPEATTNEKK